MATMKKYLDLDGLRRYTEELKGSFNITTAQQNGQVGISLAGKTIPIPVVTDSSMGLMTPNLKSKLESLDLSGLVFKGGWEGTNTQFPTGAKTGDFYVVTTGGATLNGVKLAAGDSVIKGENDDWYAIQSNVDVASDTTLGLVKGGQGTSVSADGSLNVKLQANGGLSLNENNELKVVIGDVSVENADHANTATSAVSAQTAQTAKQLVEAGTIGGINRGDTTQPVYFTNGVPVAITHTIGKSVPANAEFTDTKLETVSIGQTPATSSDYKTANEIDVFVGVGKTGTSTDGKSVTVMLETYKMPTKTYVDGIVDSQIGSLTDADIVGIFTTTQS